MNKEEIIAALERLEQKLHNINGYDAGEILFEMGILVSDSNKQKLRTRLRKLMDDATYARPSGKDIVYTPDGWGSGRYRLSKYRGK